MPHRILTALLAALACLSFAGVAQAAPPTDAQLADSAWPGSACNSANTVVLWAPLDGASAAATGAIENPDGSVTVLRCEVTIDPDVWSRATPRDRCDVWVHEEGHLAGQGHTATGVMAPYHGHYAPCVARDPWKTRQRAAVELALPKAGGWDATDWKLTCRTDRCTAQRLDGRRLRWRTVEQPDGAVLLKRLPPR